MPTPKALFLTNTNTHARPIFPTNIPRSFPTAAEATPFSDKAMYVWFLRYLVVVELASRSPSAKLGICFVRRLSSPASVDVQVDNPAELGDENENEVPLLPGPTWRNQGIGPFRNLQNRERIESFHHLHK